MKPFKLQAVLDHRQRLEDLARQALANAIARERQVMSELTDETGAMAKISGEYAQLQTKGMLIHEMQLYENRLEHQRQRLIELERALGEARNDVLRCRRELLEASKEKKLLEKLKDKSISQARSEELRREMIQIDEVAIMQRKGD